jgi:hypothetical protein
VITPAAADLEIAERVAFESESGAPDESDGCRVPGLNVRLDTVEPHGTEDLAEQ